MWHMHLYHSLLPINVQFLYQEHKLIDLTKNLQVIVTFGHSSRGTQEIILKENQHIKFFGIDFALRKGILYAKRDKEEKVFLSPGSYYINISPIKGTWVSGKTFIPFEGKHHPKQ